MLMSSTGRRTGTAFAIGWLGGIGLAGAVLLLLADSSGTESEADSPAWLAVVQLVLGAALLWLAVRQWRGRPRGDAEPPVPKWMDAVASFTPVKAAGLAALLGVVNPKNLLLVIGGASAVAQSGATAPEQAVAWVLFTLVAAIGVVVPLVFYLALGDKATQALEEVKAWMTRNNPAITAVLCLVMGAKLLGQGIANLAG